MHNRKGYKRMNHVRMTSHILIKNDAQKRRILELLADAPAITIQETITISGDYYTVNGTLRRIQSAERRGRIGRRLNK